MLIIFYRNRRLCLLLFCLFLLIAVAAVHGGAAEDDAEERNILRLSVSEYETRDTGERVVYVCGDVSLYEAGGGGVVALLVGLELSAGWSVDEVTPLEGADGMTVTVTVSEAEGGVRVLLDGLPPEADRWDGNGRVRLLRVTAVQIAEGASFGIRICGDDGFYYIDGGGEICSVPVGEECLSTENTDDMTRDVTDPTENRETTGKSDDIMLETTTNSVQATTISSETATEPEDDTDTKKDRPRSVYVGCQETPPEEGEYAVRFLFLGETPVVCAEGGGLLSLEVARTDVVEADGRCYRGDWSLCTFRGLRAEGHYIFLVYTEQGVVSVSYTAGRFQWQE